MHNVIQNLVVGIIIVSSSTVSHTIAVEPKEIFIWPAEAHVNKGVQLVEANTPAWNERLVKAPTLTPLLPDPAKRTGAACIICPGGGYGGLSMDKEGFEPAKWMQARGVAGIVLRYRCGGGPNQHPVPLQDVLRAVRVVRSNAGSWNIDPTKVGILGFSAGGHIASTAATHFDAGNPEALDPVERLSSRPDFQILVYPVISMTEEITHAGSRRNLLGENPSDELVKLMSNDLQVTPQSPPAFITHASDDDAVPVANSLLYYSALADYKVPVELHIFETGGHGFGMHRGERPADKWPEQLEPWMRQHGWVK